MMVPRRLSQVSRILAKCRFGLANDTLPQGRFALPGSVIRNLAGTVRQESAAANLERPHDAGSDASGGGAHARMEITGKCGGDKSRQPG
jgi:hypothetical protein